MNKPDDNERTLYVISAEGFDDIGTTDQKIAEKLIHDMLTLYPSSLERVQTIHFSTTDHFYQDLAPEEIAEIGDSSMNKLKLARQRISPTNNSLPGAIPGPEPTVYHRLKGTLPDLCPCDCGGIGQYEIVNLGHAEGIRCCCSACKNVTVWCSTIRKAAREWNK